MRRSIAPGCGPLTALCAVAITLVASRASADPPCTVTLRSSLGDNASWRGAVDSAEREIATRPPAGNDCREVLVDADERGAEITFTTRDRRTATRRIARPKDLRPLIAALLVTVPEPSAPATTAAPTGPTTENPLVAPVPDLESEWPQETDAVPPAPDRVRANADEHAGPVVALGAGMTVGAGEPGTVGQVEVGYLTGGWELALVGRFEPSHEAPRTAAHASLSAAGVSFLAARRSVVGPVTLVYGGAVGGFSVAEEARKDTAAVGEKRHEDDFGEPRVGATFAVLAPRIGRIRFRGQLDAQLGILDQTPKYSDLPSSPRFTLAFTLGAETNFLP